MYPISLDVRHRRVVVVGGGTVAERKIHGLVEAGAEVLLIAPTCTSMLQAQADQGALQWCARVFEPKDLDAALLVFAATNDEVINARIVALAGKRGILVNDVGSAERGTFVTPAVHRVGDLTFALETAGASPAFAMRLREELRERYDERYARATALLARMRDYAALITDPETRARALRELALRPIEELANMNAMQAEHIIDESAEGSHTSRMPTAYVCATRASPLALWQTRSIMAKLAISGTASTMLEVSTKGDQALDRSIDALGSDGVFVRELEHALREGQADYAVHSCKDLPSILPEDMHLAAISKREDPRDVFCSERYASFEALPAGATIGTSSLRRRALLQALRSDLRYVPIRGNIDTRLRKLHDGDYDAVVLAAAGLRRLNLSVRHTIAFDVERMLPAVGQGALAIECRRENQTLAGVLHAALADADTEIAVSAERAFLRRLHAGCQSPVGAYATYLGTMLTIRGVIAKLDGSRIVRGKKSAHVSEAREAELLGAMLADQLASQGGAEILGSHINEPLRNIIFLLPSASAHPDRPSRIAPALRGAGASVIEVSSSKEASALLRDRSADVLLFPSSASVETIADYLQDIHARGAQPIVAAMGEASSSSATRYGFAPHIVSPEPSVAVFVQNVIEFVLLKKAKE